LRMAPVNERRRGVRTSARFWMKIGGPQQKWRFCRGNVSESGLCVNVDIVVGEPGTISAVSLAPTSREIDVTVPARLVRIVGTHDRERGLIVRGVAFEFLPRSSRDCSRLKTVVAAISTRSEERVVARIRAAKART
jgi:hypothetical protein